MKSKLMFGIIVGITVSGLLAGCTTKDKTNENSSVSLSKANVENKTINEQVAIPKEGVKVDLKKM